MSFINSLEMEHKYVREYNSTVKLIPRDDILVLMSVIKLVLLG